MSEPLSFQAPTLEELAPLFPAYEFISFIAAGGMGAVYLARQVALERLVAIKILPRELSTNPSFHESFQREARIMARIIHPNVVMVFDCGDVDGMLYIAMEYVEGSSLFHACTGKAIDQREAAEIIRDILKGLDDAHKKGIIHRDLKPANVLLDQDGTPKVVDFGLARPVHEGEGDGPVMGTPFYTAPEIVEEGHHIDHRSDIYSVGVMLFELLSGRLPETIGLVPSAVCDSDRRFDAIVAKATHPSPELRYHSAADFANDLDQLITKLEQGSPLKLGVQTARTRGVAASLGTIGVKPSVFTTNSNPASRINPYQKKSSNSSWIFLILLALGAGFFFIYSNSKKQQPDSPFASSEVNAALPNSTPPIKTTPSSTQIQKTPTDSRISEQQMQLNLCGDSLRSGDRSHLPNGSVKLGNRVFYRIDEAMSWPQALAFCERYGAQLACLNGDATLDWFADSFLLEEEKNKKLSTKLWTGAYDDLSNGDFKWINAAAFTIPIPSEHPKNSIYLAFDSTSRRMTPLDYQEKAAFVMEWSEERVAAGALMKQFERLIQQRTQGVEIIQWPVGCIKSTEGVVACIPMTNSWHSSRSLAKEWGAQLFVPTDEASLLEMTPILCNYLTTSTQWAWCGIRFELGKGWIQEDKKVVTPTRWLEGDAPIIRDNQQALGLVVKEGECFVEPFEAERLANAILLLFPLP